MKHEAQHEQQQSFYWQEFQPGEKPGYASYDQQPLPPTSYLDSASIAAILSYSVGWMTGLLFFLFGRQHPYVRFHALQSILFFGIINAADVALFNIIDDLMKTHSFHFLTAIAILLFLFLNFVAFIGWVVGMIQAARGKYYKLPFVGSMLAHYSNNWIEPK